MASNPQIILIDGPAGAGKTTLSFELQSELNCQIVHLDSIYNGWEDGLGKSLTENLLTLIENFLAGKSHQLPTYNWSTEEFDSSQLIQPAEVLIIEGVGAGQSAIRPFATTLYWVEVDEETGLKRVLERDGHEIETQMRRWKEREAKHFELERTREFANFIITTS